MLKNTKSCRNLVPVLVHTLDILELLLRSDPPLKMHEISETTGISLTTTYRILQTLLYRGYLAQDRKGRLTVLHRPELKSARMQETGVNPRSGEAYLFEELQIPREQDEGSLHSPDEREEHSRASTSLTEFLVRSQKLPLQKIASSV